MPRFDESLPYTPDYIDDCYICGREFDRGELAWEDHRDGAGLQLTCSECSPDADE